MTRHFSPFCSFWVDRKWHSCGLPVDDNCYSNRFILLHSNT